jgi:amino acid transporter
LSGFGEPHPHQVSLIAILNSVFGFNLSAVATTGNFCFGPYERRIRGLQQMVFSSSPSRKLTPEQESVVRAHWEWAGGYAKFWIIVTVLLFGGVFLAFDYFGADDSVRIQSVVLLATIILVNAIWRAVGALAARIDLMSKTRQDHDKLNN